MNWKSILYKGLPVLLIAIAIVVVAVLVSRPDPEPQVTDGDKVVLEFNNYKVTKGELYKLLKQGTDVDTMNNTALATLMNMIDKDLLEDELSDYEITDEELSEKIEKSKDDLGEDIFYEKMILLGIIESKEDTELNEKLEDYYKVQLLKDAYTRELATDEVEEDEEGLENTINDYKEMACGIILNYDTKKESDKIKSQIEATDDIKQFFIDEWAKQQEDEEEDEEEEEYPDFIKEFTCDYDKIEYNGLASQLRNFIYSDKFLDENNNFKIESHNKIGRLISIGNIHGYYFVYILGTPSYNLEDGEDNFRESTKFVEYIKEDLIDKKLTNSYKNKKIEELREDINLKIYDKTLGESYKDSFDSKFKVEEKLLKSNKNTIASYQIDGKTKYVTADNLYSAMKDKYGMYVLMDSLNYEALKTKKNISLTKEDEKEIKDQIANLKTMYLANYSQMFSWSEYLLYTQGVSNEDDLFNHMASSKLLERYQFGYKDFKGIIEELITEDDLKEAYEKWFSIKASHIIIEYDPEIEGDKELAEAKANQILYGCTDDGAPREEVTECYIFYDIELKDENIPFVGLDETPKSKWSTVFSDLVNKNSGGDLGFFGPGAMVEEFENAAKEIAERKEDYPFSYEPVASEIEREDGTIYGIHVIYVTDKKDKPEFYGEDEDYLQYLEDLEDEDLEKDDIKDKYGDNLTKYEEYTRFMDAREEELKAEYTTDSYRNKILAELRLELSSNFKFHDKDLENILKNLDEFYTLEDDETEE